MADLLDNRPTRDFEGATRQRELAAARQAAKRANELAIAAAHKLPNGPTITATMDRGVKQSGKINVP